MNKKKEELFDYKEWEELMRKEGYDVKIPKSLEPDEVAKKLRYVKQDAKRSVVPWKSISIAASFALVVGISIFSLKNGEGMSFSNKDSSLTNTVDENTEFIEDNNVEDAESAVKEGDNSLESYNNKLAEDSVDAISEEKGSEEIDTSMLVENWMAKEDQKIIVEDETYVYAVCKELDQNGQYMSSISMYKKDSSFSQFVDKVAISNGFLAKAVYINGDMLSVVATKQQEKTTMVIFYKVEDSGCLSKIGENSLEGNLAYSIIEDGYLYVFMDSGKFGTFDAKHPNNFATTRDTGITHAGYYMNGDSLYVFKEIEGGKTKITSYTLTSQSLEKGNEQILNENRNTILAVKEDEDGLKIFVGNIGKDNGAVTLYVLDEDMNVVSQVQNIQKAQTIVAAQFLGDQVACFGVEGTGTDGDERNAYMLALNARKDGHLREVSLKELDKSKTFRSLGKAMWVQKKENQWQLFCTTKNVKQEAFAHFITWDGEDKWNIGNAVSLGDSEKKEWSGVSNDGKTCYATDGEGIVKAFTIE